MSSDARAARLPFRLTDSVLDVHSHEFGSQRAASPQLRHWVLSYVPFLMTALAVALLLPSGHPLDPVLAVAGVAAFAASWQVMLPLRVGVVVPMQPAFVLMLFAVPLNLVPALVLAAALTGDALRRELKMLPISVGDCWFSIAPVVILTAAAPGPASWSHWPIYAAAVAAEIGSNQLGWIGGLLLDGHPIPDRASRRLVTVVNILLTPLGLVVAVTGRDNPGAAIAVLLGIVAMVTLLGRERTHRLHQTGLALHDSLTGLPNRLLFDELLDATTRRIRRTGAQAALMLLDLDDFKRINDTHGHQRGDEVLCAFSRRLRESLRNADTVARLGGDEFAVLIGDPSDLDAARSVAEKLRRAFTTPLELPGGQTHAVRASIGTSIITADTPPAQALAAADGALYADKPQR